MEAEQIRQTTMLDLRMESIDRSRSILSVVSVGRPFPQQADMQRLRRDARGMPVGANESMYYVSANGRNGTENTLNWYRPGGRTADWTAYKKFLDWQLDINAVRDGYDYFIIHDDKGSQSQKDWPSGGLTPVDKWIMNNLGNGGGPVDPPPPIDPPPPVDPPVVFAYGHVIDSAYQRILLRPADPGGLEAYNAYLIGCFEQEQQWEIEYHCLAIMDEALVRSPEYQDRFVN